MLDRPPLSGVEPRALEPMGPRRQRGPRAAPLPGEPQHRFFLRQDRGKRHHPLTEAVAGQPGPRLIRRFKNGQGSAADPLPKDFGEEPSFREDRFSFEEMVGGTIDRRGDSVRLDRGRRPSDQRGGGGESGPFVISESSGPCRAEGGHGEVGHLPGPGLRPQFRFCGGVDNPVFRGDRFNRLRAAGEFLQE
jgi:hypothetical protein